MPARCQAVIDANVDTEYNRLVLIKRFCGVEYWHLQADTSAELTIIMPPTVRSSQVTGIRS